jgi:hypothetical protein
MRARECLQTILSEPICRLDKQPGGVDPMAFAPDGKLLAIEAGEGTVRLWNSRTGREVAHFDAAEPAAQSRP